jgi:hypothetical protein
VAICEHYKVGFGSAVGVIRASPFHRSPSLPPSNHVSVNGDEKYGANGFSLYDASPASTSLSSTRSTPTPTPTPVEAKTTASVASVVEPTPNTAPAPVVESIIPGFLTPTAAPPPIVRQATLEREAQVMSSLLAHVSSEAAASGDDTKLGKDDDALALIASMTAGYTSTSSMSTSDTATTVPPMIRQATLEREAQVMSSLVAHVSATGGGNDGDDDALALIASMTAGYTSTSSMSTSDTVTTTTTSTVSEVASAPVTVPEPAAAGPLPPASDITIETKSTIASPRSSPLSPETPSSSSGVPSFERQGSVSGKKCVTCGVIKGKDQYSAAQYKKANGQGKCKACV